MSGSLKSVFAGIALRAIGGLFVIHVLSCICNCMAGPEGYSQRLMNVFVSLQEVLITYLLIYSAFRLKGCILVLTSAIAFGIVSIIGLSYSVFMYDFQTYRTLDMVATYSGLFILTIFTIIRKWNHQSLLR
jgi:predicted exporter